MTKHVPGANDFALLQPLQWNTRYEVEITARNVKGLSEPTFYQFFMPQKPDITGTTSPAPQPPSGGTFPSSRFGSGRSPIASEQQDGGREVLERTPGFSRIVGEGLLLVVVVARLWVRFPSRNVRSLGK